MSTAQSIQWFPGHMARTRRQIAASLKQVDAVAEILDARIPISSSNPEIAKLVQGKPRLVLLNKADLADAAATASWVAYYAESGLPALPVDSRSGKGVADVPGAVRQLLASRIQSWERKGMVNRTVRVMVLGVPNVGKSSLINRLVKGSRAAVENRPGVTRRNQWFSIGKNLDLLDTPGVLWPKFENRTVGEHLAFTGAVKAEILDTEALSARLLELLCQRYPSAVCNRYHLEQPFASTEGFALLEAVGRARGMRIAGGDIDTERAAATVLKEFQSGKIGRITLEKAGERL